MKAMPWVLCLLMVGVAVAAKPQGKLAAKGKSLVEAKRCQLCHEEGGRGKPMEALAGGRTDDYIRDAVRDPKKTIAPNTFMPNYKLSDDEMQAVIQYLRSLSKP